MFMSKKIRLFLTTSYLWNFLNHILVIWRFFGTFV